MSHPHPNSLEELSPREVAELLYAHQILLIDVREPDEGAWKAEGLPVLQIDPATGKLAST